MTAFPPRIQIQFPVSQLVTVSTSLRLGHLIDLHLRQNRTGLLLCSSFQEFCHSDHRVGIKDVWHERVLQAKRNTYLKALYDVFSATHSSCSHFFSGREPEKSLRHQKNIGSETSRRDYFNGRLWTNVLLATNVMVFVAQIATEGKLMLWGAKINSLINQGQLWRLITSSFLHANIGHLLINCYSLNSVGPTVEKVSGSRRFLAVYLTSMISSSMTSYFFCKAPSVGASGAIFGLVGSFAVFVSRHKYLIGGGKDDLMHIARVIVLNMVIGVLSRGIDNWGHLGGLLGGVAMSWLLGPAWTYETKSIDGRLIFADKPPVASLFKWTRKLR